MEALGDSIAEVSALLSAGKHTQLTRIREFDAEGAWGAQGARSMAHWLNWRIGLSLPAAREHVRVARALGEFRRIDEGLRLGVLSYSKVRAMVRVATAKNEAYLVNLARASTAAQLEKTCRGVQRNTRPDPGDLPRQPYVSFWSQDDGTVALKGRLPADLGALLRKSVDAAKRDAYQSRRTKAEDGDCSNMEQKSDSAESPPDSTPRFTNVDALRALASTYLATEREPGSRPGHFEVLLHVDHDVLAADDSPSATPGETLARCRLDEGQAVSLETARRLTCDAPTVVVLVDGTGKTLDVGRRTRAISAALYRALWLRDGGCCFPGCTNRLFVEGHHIKHWALGGETKLSNLVILCWAHHHLLHEEGFTLTVTPEGAWRFCDPRGGLIPAAPQPPPIFEPAIPTLVAQAAAEGIEVHRYTAIPSWDGGPPDYDVMISSLIA